VDGSERLSADDDSSAAEVETAVVLQHGKLTSVDHITTEGNAVQCKT